MYDDEKCGQCRSGLDITTNMKISSCFCSIPFKNIDLKSFDNLFHAWLTISSIEDYIRWEHNFISSCKTCDLHFKKVCQGGCLGYKICDMDIIDKSNVGKIYYKEGQDEYNKKLSKIYINFLNEKYDEALSLINSVEQEDKDSKIKHVCLYIYVIKGMITDAEAIAYDLVEHATFPSNLAHEIAGVMQKFGFKDEAIKIMEKSLKIKNQNITQDYKTHLGLAKLYHERGENEISSYHNMQAIKETPRALKMMRERNCNEEKKHEIV